VVKEEVGFLTDISESKAKRLMEFQLAQRGNNRVITNGMEIFALIYIMPILKCELISMLITIPNLNADRSNMP